jgi:hypothetical protein
METNLAAGGFTSGSLCVFMAKTGKTFRIALR